MNAAKVDVCFLSDVLSILKEMQWGPHPDTGYFSCKMCGAVSSAEFLDSHNPGCRVQDAILRIQDSISAANPPAKEANPPKHSKVKAADVVPLHWGLWIQSGERQFVCDICHASWSKNGEEIVFGLDNHTFFSAGSDQILDLVPLCPREHTIKSRSEARLEHEVWKRDGMSYKKGSLFSGPKFHGVVG